MIYTVVFIGLCLTVLRVAIHKALPYIQAYGNWPGAVIGFVLVITLLCAAATEWIGIHAIFGAFMAGVAIGDSRHLRRHRTEPRRGRCDVRQLHPRHGADRVHRDLRARDRIHAAGKDWIALAYWRPRRTEARAAVLPRAPDHRLGGFLGAVRFGDPVGDSVAPLSGVQPCVSLCLACARP